MKKLICPNCRKESGVPKGAHGIHTHTCINCKVNYGVMYIAGFNDGMRDLEKSVSEQNNQTHQVHNKPLNCDWCGKKGGRVLRLHKQCYEGIINGEGII